MPYETCDMYTRSSFWHCLDGYQPNHTFFFLRCFWFKCILKINHRAKYLKFFSVLSCGLKSAFWPPKVGRGAQIFTVSTHWVSPWAISDFLSGLSLGWAACLQVNGLKARETSLNSELLRKKTGWEIRDSCEKWPQRDFLGRMFWWYHEASILRWGWGPFSLLRGIVHYASIVRRGGKVGRTWAAFSLCIVKEHMLAWVWQFVRTEWRGSWQTLLRGSAPRTRLW